MGNALEVGADIRLNDAVLCLRHARNIDENKYIVHQEGEIVFLKVKLEDIEAFCTSELGKELRTHSGTVPCVGSGAWRLEATLKQWFPLATFQRHREAPCLLAGLSVFNNPLFRFIPEEGLWDMGASESSAVLTEAASLPIDEPYLLVTMKSGCSFFRVGDGIRRIGGSSVGGCTFNALMATLVSIEDPPIDGASAVEDSVDLTVGDIYGGEEVPASLNLPSHVIASVFGRANGDASSPAVARSIYNLLAINTAQLAFLHASLIGCKTVVFAFMQGREVQYRMNKFLQYWSKGVIQTVFCAHADLLACAGTLVLPGDSTTYEEHRFDETCTSLQLSIEEEDDA